MTDRARLRLEYWVVPVCLTFLSSAYAIWQSELVFPVVVIALTWIGAALMAAPRKSRSDQRFEPSVDPAGPRASIRLEEELAIAGRIQASFLPEALPAVPGWDVAASLLPARETSGDFYDMYLLPDGKLVFLIADVTDKGLGAALFMALARTTLRIFTSEHPQRPELALRAANRYILRETSAGLFVTAFLGILDSESGRLVYANAGHNPPFAWHSQGNQEVTPLAATGIPLGLLDDAVWRQGTLRFQSGGGLLLYTDGVTEAESADGVFFGTARLRSVIEGPERESASELTKRVLKLCAEFSEGRDQSDDIAVMAVKQSTKPRVSVSADETTKEI